VNDRFGHAAGDDILRAFGRIMRESARTNDIIIRWGGEEFLAVLPHTTREQAVAFAERIRQSLGGTVPKLSITVSAGVTELVDDEPPEVAISRADHNMYRAKNAGRNRVCADEPLLAANEAPRVAVHE